MMLRYVIASLLVVLKIFLPFSRKKELDFFLIGLTKNDRQKTLFSAEREERSLHSFTREEAFSFETSSSYHHHHQNHRE